MPALLSLRQSPSLSRALILEARAARGRTLELRLRALLARACASEALAIDVVARTPPARR
jgi:hypothetical protein